MRRVWILILLMVSFAGSAHAYLPQDRFAWWDAVPPPTGAFGSYDSLEEFFNEPIVQVVDFNQAGGWPADAIVSVRRADGNPARLVNRQVLEHGSSVRRLVLQVEPGPVDPENPPQQPAANAPAVLEFSTPQRAVAIEFGFICTSEGGCQTSSGRRGVDANAFELRAYDKRHYLLYTASLPGSFNDELTENEVSYTIGLRHQEAEIHRVELILGRDHWGGAPLEADLLIRRIHHEALPHAAVLQTEVAVGTPLVETLPFNFDQATAIVRGYDLTEPTVFALTGFNYSVDSSVANSEVTVTASGVTKTEVNKASGQLTRVFISLIGWNSSQVELYTKDTHIFGRGEQVVGRDRSVLDPCRNNACGPPSGVAGWPAVVMTSGLDFDQIDTKGSNHWQLFTLNHDPTFTRDLSRGLIQQFFGSAFLRQGDDPVYEVDMRRRLLTGRSVVMNTNPSPPSGSSYPIPSFITQTNVTGRITQYGASTLESLGHFCDVDAPVVAVGGRVYWLNARGSGNPYTENSGAIPEAIDMEVRGHFTGGRVRASVHGRLLNVPVGISQTRAQGQVFVSPACAGIQRVRRDAVPIVSGARFVGLLNQSTPAREAGRVFNRGPGPFTIQRLRLTGADASAFDLHVHLHGQYLGPLSSFGRSPTLVLNAGDELTIDGSFLPQKEQQFRAEIEIETDLPGQQWLSMPVNGRIPATAEWFPTYVNFGMQEVHVTTARNALLTVPDIIPVQVDCFEVADDPERNFTALPDAGFGGPCDGMGPTLAPGDATLVQITFSPTVLSPRALVEDKTATLIAHTDYGPIEMPLYGAVVPPPEPVPELLGNNITFGLVAEGETEERMLTLRNWGAGALQLAPPTLSGDTSFHVVPQPGDWPPRLGPDSSWSFSVNFTAAPPEGLRNGSLEIQTNAGPLTVTFSGYTVE